MTWSVIARDPQTNDFGIIVASRFFAVGAIVPYIRGGKCAVASQAFISPLWGMEAAERLAAGDSSHSIIADFLGRDAGAAHRQIHMVDAAGRTAAHTGASCIPWAGHQLAENTSVAGNMLAGPQVIERTLETYLGNMHVPFPERLLSAMEAGEAAGGDKRGRQSAALRVHRGEDYPWFDLRVDDHGAPLSELRRLYAVAQERFVHFAETMPTRANFSGVTDRTDLDRKLQALEDERIAAGRPSASHAVSAE